MAKSGAAELERSAVDADLDEARLDVFDGIGQPQQMRSLVEVYLASTETRLKALAELAADGDRQEIRKLAHDLAGASGNYGARRMERSARRLMAACILDGRGPLLELVRELSLVYSATAAAFHARYAGPRG